MSLTQPAPFRAITQSHRTRIRVHVPLVCAAVVALLLSAPTLLACSTFVLQEGDQLVCGHNLDSYDGTVGLVVVNKRDTARKSASWQELISQKPHGPEFTWRSRWGSITFNTWGIGYPDGGMNERGLYVQEMSLAGASGPISPDKPVLFAPVWIQYVLDTCETTEEVVQSLSRFNIQESSSPNQWHYLVADRSGDRAIVECMDGKTVVHRRDSMPVPLLCNESYANDVENWMNLEKNPEAAKKSTDPRFARAAKIIQGTTAQGPDMDRAKVILASLHAEGTQLGYLFDFAGRNLRYFTRRDSAWRTLSLQEVDFSPGPTVAWDMDEPDRSKWLKPLSIQENQRHVDRCIDALQAAVGRERLEELVQSLGGSTQNLRVELANSARWN